MLTKKSPQIIALRETIEKCRCDEYIDELLPAAQELHGLAMRDGNADLRDIAHCILGDAYLQNMNYHKAMYFIMAGIKGLELTDEYQLICRCYNEMGIIYENKDYLIAAEDSYLKAIEIAKEHHLHFEEGMACSNFSCLCSNLYCSEDALEYSFRALDCLNKVEPATQRTKYFIATEYAFILKQYLRLHITDKAKEYYALLNAALTELPKVAEFFDINIALLYFYHYIDDEIQEKLYTEKCIQYFHECQEYFLYGDEIVDLFNFLLEHDELDILQKLFVLVDNANSKKALLNLRRQVEEIRIAMYQKLNDINRMNESAYNYFLIMKERDDDNVVSFKNWLSMQSQLIKEKTRNIFLTALAESDSLTGVANRYKMNEVIEELFTMADTEGRNLGVEILDVDTFKDINDSYGHSIGDEVLKGIGDILLGISTDTIFVARYGGDEFVIFYYDMSDSDIMSCAGLISDEISELSQRLGIPLTISQGIVNHIPRPHNRTWDYMNAADNALYYVKNNGRNNIKLVHSAREV